MKQKCHLAFFIIFSLVLSTGVHAQARENSQGNAAYDAGKYELALDKFQKARSRAEKAGDVQYRAMATYGMARASAQLCRPVEAEALFRESISLREGIPDDERAYHFVGLRVLPDNLFPKPKSESQAIEALGKFADLQAYERPQWEEGRWLFKPKTDDAFR